MAEAWRNLTAVGARPLAITDNMNFGNPEKPEVMGQFAAAIRGMAEACRALDFPVVSGNVSLYNETEGRAILPTPAIGGLGVLDDAAQAVGIALPPWLDLVLIGDDARAGSASRSGCARSPAGRRARRRRSISRPSARNGDFVRGQIVSGGVRACHDVSDGGLLVAVAEMAMAGDTGVRLSAGPPRRARPRASGSARTRAATCWPSPIPPPSCAGAEAAGRAGHAHRPQRRAGFDTARWRNHIGRGVARRRMSASSRPGWTPSG